MVMGVNMGIIFIYVQNPKKALETLLYVFKEQLMFGYTFNKMIVKHSDGCRLIIQGTVDQVFKSGISKSIEYKDVIIFHHSFTTDILNETKINRKILLLDDMLSIF